MKKNRLIYVLSIVLNTTLFIVAIGVVSMLTIINVLEKSSHKELSLTAQNVCQEFDSNIHSIEQCVNTLSLIATNHLTDMEEFKTNPAYVDAYTEELRQMLLYSIQNTQGAMSIYIRYNRELASPTSGLMFALNPASGDFSEYPVTDLDKFAGEKTIWYDQPVKNGKPTWIKPYENNYNGLDVISYVVPYYYENELVGIIGVDIDIAYIKEYINSIKLYDTGFAFLCDGNGKVVVHKNYRLNDPIASVAKIKEVKGNINEHGESNEYHSGQNTVVFTVTKNDMMLCVQASNSELYAASRSLIGKIIIIELLALLTISIVATLIMRKLFKMSDIDVLTGLYNRKCFMRIYDNMKPEERYKYSLFLFDIDKFKHINDTYGHNIGDKAIHNAAQIAKKKIGDAGILARWGGDEFIGIINTHLAETTLEDLRATMEHQEDPEYGKVTISIGYTHIKDNPSFVDICDKADKALYESKENGRNLVTKN